MSPFAARAQVAANIAIVGLSLYGSGFNGVGNCVHNWMRGEAKCKVTRGDLTTEAHLTFNSGGVLLHGPSQTLNDLGSWPEHKIPDVEGELIGPAASPAALKGTQLRCTVLPQRAQQWPPVQGRTFPI